MILVNIMKKLLLHGIGFLRKLLDKAESSLEHGEEKMSADSTPIIETPTVEIPSEAPHVVTPHVRQTTDRQSVAKDRIEMNALMSEWSVLSGIELKELKSKLRSHAKVVRIDYMTLFEVQEACDWIKKEIESIKKH